MHVLPYLSYISSLIISLLFPFLIQIFLRTVILCFPSSFVISSPIIILLFPSLLQIFLRKMILYMFSNLRALHGYWAKWQLLHLFSAAFFFPYHRMCMCVLTRCLMGLVSSSQFNTLRPVCDSSEPTGSKSIKKIEFMWGYWNLDRIGRIWWFGFATSTSDQELDAGNSVVALLLLTLLPMFHLFSELETFDPNGSSCFTWRCDKCNQSREWS